ncbi:hypothetical protein [Kingella kingae]|nr:hypothetical protein [Kingella kingae]MDK4536616.1 hypothetical protein [Kingella kingae]MDK4538686.1 hypothetical protein [Kingella kingae]MDK4623519.1 hypothetical protein [Kingella kingae]UOP03218.1 hypothetical protein LVJ79_01270 [Kingella kingae]
MFASSQSLATAFVEQFPETQSLNDELNKINKTSCYQLKFFGEDYWDLQDYPNL